MRLREILECKPIKYHRKLFKLHNLTYIKVILSSYDFDGTQALSIDEVTLALKSTATGLCKLSTNAAPKEETIEQLVAAVS